MKRKTISTIMSLLLASAVLTACGNTSSEVSTGEGNALAGASEKVIPVISVTMNENALEDVLKAGKEAALTKKEEMKEQNAVKIADTEVTAETADKASTNKNNAAANGTSAAETKNSAILMPSELKTNTSGGTIDRTKGEEVFALVNAERAAAGLNELTWDEDLYNIAVERCYENDGHDSVREGTGENYAHWYGMQDSQSCHDSWHYSPGHYNNYMAAFYTKGAVAFLPTENGELIGYEIFAGDSYGKSSNKNAITATNGTTVIEYHRHGTDPYSKYCPYCNPGTGQENSQSGNSSNDILSDTAVFTGTAEEVQAMHDERERLQAEEREREIAEAEAEVRRMEQELGIKILDD